MKKFTTQLKEHKKLLIGGGIVLVLLLAFLGIRASTTVTYTPAVISVDEGDVFVDIGHGYKYIEGSMELKQGDRVRTGEGRATILYYDSVLQELDPNTEIVLEGLDQYAPKIKQLAGSTWNKFTSLSGVETFQTETPTSVAIVRGTGYEHHEEHVLVLDGTVQAHTKVDGQDWTLTRNQEVNRNGTTWFTKRLAGAHRERMIIRQAETIKKLQNIRWEFILEHEKTYAIMKKVWGSNDEEVQQLFDDLDHDRLDLDETVNRLPARGDIINHVISMTEVIKKEVAVLESYQE